MKKTSYRYQRVEGEFFLLQPTVFLIHYWVLLRKLLRGLRDPQADRGQSQVLQPSSCRPSQSVSIRMPYSLTLCETINCESCLDDLDPTCYGSTVATHVER